MTALVFPELYTQITNVYLGIDSIFRERNVGYLQNNDV